MSETNKKPITFNVVEIFKSIDGEGITAGYPAIFIRFAGCNLRCSYCDSMYAVENAKYTVMELSEILSKVEDLDCKRITLTGGEPLIQPYIDKLVMELVDRKYKINIETNGAVYLKKIYPSQCVRFTMDYKCPSSGMEDKMIMENIKNLDTEDVLKFVVGSIEDLNTVRHIYSFTRANVFISPVFGKIEPKEIVKFMLEHNMNTCRIQLQLHKFIWDPDMRGV